MEDKNNQVEQGLGEIPDEGPALSPEEQRKQELMAMIAERQAARDSSSQNSGYSRVLDSVRRFSLLGTGQGYSQSAASGIFSDEAKADAARGADLGKNIDSRKKQELAMMMQDRSQANRLEQIKAGLRRRQSEGKVFAYKDSKFVSESGDPVIQTGPQEYSVNGKPYTGKLIRSVATAKKGYQSGSATTEDGRALIFDPSNGDFLLAGTKERYLGKVRDIRDNANRIRGRKLDERIDENQRKEGRFGLSFDERIDENTRKQGRFEKNLEVKLENQRETQEQNKVRNRKTHGEAFSKYTKDVVKVFTGISTVRDMLKDPNRLTSQAIQSILPRLAGDVGALSDSDRRVWASFPGALNWIQSMSQKIMDQSTKDKDGNIIFSNETTLTDAEIQQLTKIVDQLESKKKEMYRRVRGNYANKIVTDTDDGRPKEEQMTDALSYLGVSAIDTEAAPEGKVKVTNGSKILLIKKENLKDAIKSGYKLIK